MAINLDVQREGDKAARRIAMASVTDLAAVRKMELSAIAELYHIAVKYEGVPAGKFNSWRLGWRKGYGVR